MLSKIMPMESREDMAYWIEGYRAAMFLISRIVSETLLWERLLQDTSGRRS
jgi:hypothetical protein